MSEIAVELRAIKKSYGSVVAVESMDLAVQEGEFVSFLGPSGCGKTTTLRMIAGLESPTSGEIYICGKYMNNVPIHKRNIGIVFQNYALFPHKSVFDNVAFGLRYRSCSKDEIDKRVRDVISMVQLDGMEQRYSAELSGGQQQRVALARAIVIQPDLLLLDEPLSALDANLREDMRVELKQIQQETGITTLFITHDQSEALAMSDRIAVMSKGKVEQLDEPQTLYNQPKTVFCASFLGNANLLEAKVTGGQAGAWELESNGFTWISASNRNLQIGADITAVLRAEHFHIAAGDEGNNVLAVTISNVDYIGISAHYLVLTNFGAKLELFGSVGKKPLVKGDKINVHIEPENIVLL